MPVIQTCWKPQRLNLLTTVRPFMAVLKLLPPYELMEHQSGLPQQGTRGPILIMVVIRRTLSGLKGMV